MRLGGSMRCRRHGHGLGSDRGRSRASGHGDVRGSVSGGDSGMSSNTDSVGLGGSNQQGNSKQLFHDSSFLMDG